jgi:hypothetical protein
MRNRLQAPRIERTEIGHVPYNKWIDPTSRGWHVFRGAKATPVPSWSFCFAGGHSAMLAAHPPVIQVRVDPKNGLDKLITFPEKSPNH